MAQAGLPQVSQRVFEIYGVCSGSNRGLRGTTRPGAVLSSVRVDILAGAPCPTLTRKKSNTSTLLTNPFAVGFLIGGPSIPLSRKPPGFSMWPG